MFVFFDADVAQLYGVETKRINETVSRNQVTKLRNKYELSELV